jgi:hypothetical protein
MKNKLARIKRLVRAGQWFVESHCLDELSKDGFTLGDLKNAILLTEECDELTDDPSHARYVLHGQALDERPLTAVVFFRGRNVRIKTAYEPYE